MGNKIGILGYGEIGKSIHELYKKNENFNVFIREIDYSDDFSDLYILNICIPFKKQDKFIEIISNTIKETKPKLTIIHSTVLPETTNKIKEITKSNVVHSPVRGVHPNLYEGLKTFIKYVGYNSEEEKNISKNHFEKLDVKTEFIKNPSNTELAKLYSTTYYGLCIAFHGEMKKHFDSLGLDFKIINEWNETYNEGYTKLNKKNVVRPNLYPPVGNKIGGHCVISNTDLLNEIFTSEVFDLILKYK